MDKEGKVITIGDLLKKTHEANNYHEIIFEGKCYFLTIWGNTDRLITAIVNLIEFARNSPSHQVILSTTTLFYFLTLQCELSTAAAIKDHHWELLDEWPKKEKLICELGACGYSAWDLIINIAYFLTIRLVQIKVYETEEMETWPADPNDNRLLAWQNKLYNAFNKIYPERDWPIWKIHQTHTYISYLLHEELKTAEEGNNGKELSISTEGYMKAKDIEKRHGVPRTTIQRGWQLRWVKKPENSIRIAETLEEFRSLKEKAAVIISYKGVLYYRNDWIAENVRTWKPKTHRNPS